MSTFNVLKSMHEELKQGRLLVKPRKSHQEDPTPSMQSLVLSKKLGSMMPGIPSADFESQMD